jgi:hypothetical protein
VLLLGARCRGLDDREYLCELAVAQLLDCCAAFPVEKITCSARHGCQGFTEQPTLTADESRCIYGLDCADVRARGLCKVVPALKPAVHEECPPPPDMAGGGWFFGEPRKCTYTDVSETRAPVCQ